VMRSGTSETLGKVEIRLIRPGQSSSDVEPEAITDWRGRFTLSDVAPGRYVLLAQRGGYANPSQNGEPLKEGGPMRTVVVPPNSGVMNVSLSLSPGGVIAGHVMDPEGKPAADWDGRGMQVWAARILPDGTTSPLISKLSESPVHSLSVDGST